MTDREGKIAEQWKRIMESGTIEYRIREAVYAMENQGYDVSKAKLLLQDAEMVYKSRNFNKLLKTIGMINEELRRAPKMELDYYKPEKFEEILNSCTPLVNLARFPQEVDSTVYYDKVYGGWYGKCIGVALGDPVAGYTPEKVKMKYGRITDYLESPRTSNDDLLYPIVLLHTIEECGMGFTSRDLAYEWLEHLVPEYTFTAERIALENIRRGIIPPFSASENNPFNEWIGAQMRGEVNGFIAPGDPETAISFAYRDATVSHKKEGVYSELFNAAVISAAFVEKDIWKLTRIGLSYVPRCSEFYNTVNTTYQWCDELRNPEAVLERIRKTYSTKYHWIHTFPNIAIVIMSLLLGEGDFERSICLSANCGFDADCTTGQIGSTVGVLLGEANIPIKWKQPLNNKLKTRVIEFEEMKIDELTEWTFQVRNRVKKELH